MFISSDIYCSSFCETFLIQSSRDNVFHAYIHEDDDLKL
jgi:hypothetical protein